METLYIDKNADLIEKCRRGNRKAQMKIYSLYADAMFNLSVHIVKDSAEAEDVVQESFIKAFDKLDTFRGEVSFGSWLKRIVVNRSLDLIRKNTPIFEEIDERRHDAAESEEIVLDNQPNIEDVKMAIDGLPDKYRVILTLFLIEGYDHDEICDILNISYASSRTQYHRAKEKLKAMLKERSYV